MWCHYICDVCFTGFPNGLAIDYVNERLYWADGKKDKIETATLEGNSRVTLIQDVNHPFGLTLVSNWVLGLFLSRRKKSGYYPTLVVVVFVIGVLIVCGHKLQFW